VSARQRGRSRGRYAKHFLSSLLNNNEEEDFNNYCNEQRCKRVRVYVCLFLLSI